MKIALIQSDIVWADPRANADKLRKALEDNPGADLYVLPEMFSTGFNSPVVEDSSLTLDLMRELAVGHNCAIAGSLAVKESACDGPEGRVFNRLYFVREDGSFEYYDKRHLFANGGEDKLCVAGKERKIVEWRGMRFLLLVCFDLRFPVWARNRGDYDAIICVASWPALRRYHWDTLLKARAIENQAYMIGVNRVGSDPQCEYDGGSVLLDPWGAVLTSCPDGSECVRCAEAELQIVQECRRKFPAQNDADGFSFSAAPSIFKY